MDISEARLMTIFQTKNARMRAGEAEYKCRLHKLTPTDIRTEPRTEPRTETGVSREAPPLKTIPIIKI